MELKISVNDDELDSVVAQLLRESLGYYEKDLEQAQKGIKVSVFSTDLEEDIIQLKAAVASFKFVIGQFTC